jgi:hypothetical protein
VLGSIRLGRFVWRKRDWKKRNGLVWTPNSELELAVEIKLIRQNANSAVSI